MKSSMDINEKYTPIHSNAFLNNFMQQKAAIQIMRSF